MRPPSLIPVVISRSVDAGILAERRIDNAYGNLDVMILSGQQWIF
jgi:hypothetical protein